VFYGFTCLVLRSVLEINIGTSQRERMHHQFPILNRINSGSINRHTSPNPLVGILTFELAINLLDG